MLKLLSADLLVLLHFLFVVFGGFLVWKWKKLAWLHLPAALWGALLEFGRWICPLTRLENLLRSKEQGGYSSGFIEHYQLPIIYPGGLTREIQIALGVIVVLLNVFIYGALFMKQRASRAD